MRWTANDLKKKNLNHNYKKDDLRASNTLKRTSTSKKDKNPAKALKSIKKEKISIEKQTIKTVLWVLHRENKIPKFVEELQFHHTRKFRFDWAIPELKLAIEYEGLMSEKSGHTTIKGYTKDTEKYNLAQLEGWIVLRYTALNYNNLSNDLKKIIEKVK